MRRQKKQLISLVVPVYNEVDRIENLRTIISFCRKQKFPIELIVVNDGSSDQTLKYLKRFHKQFPFELITYPINHGKGYAIQQGMLKANGDWRFFFDVDLSVPLDSILQFLKHTRADILIGTRRSAGAEVKVHQPVFRESLGKVFTSFSRLWLGSQVSDFTCGFKCFSHSAADLIFPQLQCERWGFDAEIIFLAQKYKLKIKEIPVVWCNDARTKVRFPQDLIRSIRELLSIRWNDVRGIYR